MDSYLKTYIAILGFKQVMDMLPTVLAVINDALKSQNVAGATGNLGFEEIQTLLLKNKVLEAFILGAMGQVFKSV